MVDPALAWSEKLSVEVGGAGTVAAAGVVLPRLLADWLGLCTELAEVMARSGFVPLRHRGRADLPQPASSPTPDTRSSKSRPAGNGPPT
ncbi:MAG: hypothetical protein ACRDRW_01810 [Pseudonocardiaceae bacterium]